MKKLINLFTAAACIMSMNVPAAYSANDNIRRINLFSEDFGKLDLSEYTTEDAKYRVTIVGCENLEVLNIPDRVVTLDIQSCPSLREIYVSEGNETYSSIDGVLFDKTAETLLLYPRSSPRAEYTVPEGVRKINKEAFAEAKVESVILPNSLVTIDSRAFAESDLKSIVIPPNVRGECESVFYKCKSLTDVTFYDITYSPNMLTSFPTEEDNRYFQMFKYMLSPKITLHVPAENYDSYFLVFSGEFPTGWNDRDPIEVTVIPMEFGSDDDMKYDVNKDGTVGIADVVTLNGYILGKTYGYSISADLNGDGAVDVFDMVLMRQYFASKI